MIIRLDREIFTAQSTIGRLFIDDVFRCWTLEDIDRELTSDMPVAEIWGHKIHGRTAIPRGEYTVVVSMSSKFKRLMPLLLNVPAFVGIRIHPGNNQYHTEGCILIGLSHGINEIYSSRQAFNLIFPIIQQAADKKEPISIRIAKAETPPLAGLPPVAPAAVSSTRTV